MHSDLAPEGAPPPTDEPMTASEVADLFGVSIWTVRSWARRKQGPPFYRIVGSIRYDRAEVLAWKAAQRAS